MTLTAKQEINWKEGNQMAFQCNKEHKTYNFQF